MSDNQYDVTIIGAGPGGYSAAIRAAQLGLAVALVDDMNAPGGTCLNLGCIPAKALLDTTELYRAIREDAAGHGIGVKGLSFDLSKIMKRKDEVVSKMTRGLGEVIKANGIVSFRGRGRIAGPGEVRVAPVGGGEAVPLKSGAIVIATGSVPAALPFLPFDGAVVVSSDQALSFSEPPAELVVVGGGAVGLELGSVWARLGSRVTVIELEAQILPGSDEEAARALARELSRQGLAILNLAKVTGLSKSGKKAAVEALDRDGKPLRLPADKVLVAVGRRADYRDLGIEENKIALDTKSKKIAVDGRFETNVKGVFAIGDTIRGPMLAHKAMAEGEAAAEILSGKPGLVNYAAIPNVVYTWPEAAAVGMTEQECRAAGTPFRKGIFFFKANGRGVTSGQGVGFAKLLAHADTDRLLGAHVVGPWASDLIGEAVSVIEFGGSAEDVARTIHAHPTLSEAVKEAAMDVGGWAIHAFPKKPGSSIGP